MTRSFPPLRAEPARRKRRAERPGKGGLRDRAWAVRATLPVKPEPERAAVSRLAAALFQAEHAHRDATAFLNRIDRTDVERRLKSYREMSLTSRRAASQASKLEQHLRLIDTLAAARETLLAVGRREHPDESDITEATRAVQELMNQARETIGDSAEPLRRTLWPGVYRSPSGEYVVRGYDTAGIEQRHHFKSRTEARAYRAVVAREHRNWRFDYQPSMARIEASAASATENVVAGGDVGSDR